MKDVMRLVTNELLARLERLRIPSRRRIRSHHRGEQSSLRKGASLEFSDYREYLPGDDIRSIDWNTYARTERLYLKLYLEEESKPVYVLVDCSASMNFGDPTKFEYALALAACLSYVSLRRYDRPRMLLVRDESFQQFPFRSQNQFFAILPQLEKEKTSGETHLSAGLKKIALAGLPRGIYFVLSDFYSYDGYQGLKVLAASGNEIHCLQILTPEETAPGLRGDLRLVDSETADHTEVSISPQSLRRYLQQLRLLQDQVRTTAHHSPANYYSISTSTSLSDLLTGGLRKTGILT